MGRYSLLRVSATSAPRSITTERRCLHSNIASACHVPRPPCATEAFGSRVLPRSSQKQSALSCIDVSVQDVWPSCRCRRSTQASARDAWIKVIELARQWHAVRYVTWQSWQSFIRFLMPSPHTKKRKSLCFINFIGSVVDAAALQPWAEALGKELQHCWHQRADLSWSYENACLPA